MSLWLSSIQSGLDGPPYSWAWTRGRKFSLFQKKKINSKWYFGGGDHDGSVIFMPCSRDVAHIYSETLPDPFSWTSFLKKARALSSDLASNVEVISKASTRVDRIAWRAKKRSKRAQGRALFLFARFSALFFGTSAGRIPTPQQTSSLPVSCAQTQALGAIIKMAALSAGWIALKVIW